MVHRAVGFAVPVFAALLLSGCADDAASVDGPAAGGGAASTPCGPGEFEDPDGSCCPAGTSPLDDGSCLPAGIPPELCGHGFEHDGGQGCEPILPSEPCPEGLMAVPGETECREVMACGEGRWGDIPLDATTVYVDHSYDQGAGPSDGTESRPYTTVGEAVTAAPADALVAIAPGSYAEDVLLSGKPLRLWGKCPAEVELVGTGDLVATVFIRGGASGSELAGLAIRGLALGIVASGAENLELHGLWVHHNAHRGINLEDTLGPTSAAVSSSLIEHNHVSGVFVGGSEAELEAIVVRDTQPQPSNQRFGSGVGIQYSTETGTRSSVSLRGSVIERNHNLGLYVAGSDAGLEASVVRNTLPQASDQTAGRGIAVQDAADTGLRSSVSVRGSLCEHNHDLGVFISGSDAVLEAIVVRDTLPQASDQTAGRGINIQASPDTRARSSAVLRASLIELNHQGCVFVSGSDAELDAIVVRNTLPRASDQTGGRGINIQDSLETGAQSSATLRASLSEHNHEFGVAVLSSHVTVASTVVRDTLPRQTDDLFGDGVVVVSDRAFAGAHVGNCRVEGSARAGFATFGARVTLGQSLFDCNRIHLNGETHEGAAYSFDDLGGNACGCMGETLACAVQSASLEPPEPLPL